MNDKKILLYAEKIPDGSYTKYRLRIMQLQRLFNGKRANFVIYVYRADDPSNQLVLRINLGERYTTTVSSFDITTDLPHRGEWKLRAIVSLSLKENKNEFRGQPLQYESDFIIVKTYEPPSTPPAPFPSVVMVNNIPRIQLLLSPPSDWGGGRPGRYSIQVNSTWNNVTFNIDVNNIAPTDLRFPTFYMVPGLEPGQTYTFRVAAFSQDLIMPSHLSSSSAPIYLPGEVQFSLFNKNSWNNLNIPTRIKNQLNKAADNWANLITVDLTTRNIISQRYPQFSRGIFLDNMTMSNDPSMSAVACVPSKVVSVNTNSSEQKGIIAVGFSMRLNAHYFNTLTDYDWELAFTHHLGHALGIGFINRTSPLHQLSGTRHFGNAQRAYNDMRREWLRINKPRENPNTFTRNFVPLDHIGPVVTDDLVGFDGSPSVSINDNLANAPSQSNIGSLFWHWGLVRNNDSRFKYLHPTIHINNDIMGYRYPNQDKSISLLSVKLLVDMGYSEVSPNNFQRKTTPPPPTTITNKQLCSNLSIGITNRTEIVAQSVDELVSSNPAPVILFDIDKNYSVTSYLEPKDIDPCYKWYCGDSGCEHKNSLEIFDDRIGYNTLEDCEANCDSAGNIGPQYYFDSQSKEWRNK